MNREEGRGEKEEEEEKEERSKKRRRQRPSRRLSHNGKGQRLTESGILFYIKLLSKVQRLFAVPRGK